MGPRVESDAAGVDARAMRSVLGRFCTGVTVVSTALEDRVHAMTANAFTSVSLDPPLVLVSVDRRAMMHRLLPDTRRYGVSVLAASQERLARHFAGRPMAEAGELFEFLDGVPLLRGAIAHVSCRLYAAHPAGDHTLYLGNVDYLRSMPGDPLLFTSGSFGRLAAAELAELWGW